MKVLIAKATLVIPQSKSLKDKRRVVKAIKDRVWSKFRVSISEIEDNHSHTRAVLGFVYVSNDTQVLQSVMNKVINLVENNYPGMLYDYISTIEQY